MDINESSITKVYNYNGRVKSVRVMGKSSFVHIMSHGEAIQLYAKKDVTENFDEFLNLKVGDLISVHEAEEFVTKTGEPSLRVLRFKIQHVPVISMPFPKSTEDAEYFQITDKETRYRQRYIDLQIRNQISEPMRLWMDPESGYSFKKVCVSVDSEGELLALAHEAYASHIPCKIITDSGDTEFNGVPTITCMALGPDWSEVIDEITGELKLL